MIWLPHHLHLQLIYLLVRFIRPIVLDGRITETANFFEHGLHKSGAKLFSVSWFSLALLISLVFTTAWVIVECRQIVKELTPPLHIPVSNAALHDV